MTNWEELLERHAAGTLRPEEEELVAEKLAEVNAVQEYLWRQEKADLAGATDLPPLDSKKMKKQVNQKFLKLVLLVFAALALGGSVLYFGVVPLVEKTYFDPRAKQTESTDTDYQIYQALYTELTSPQFRLINSQIDKVGFATYHVRNFYESKFYQNGFSQNQVEERFVRGVKEPTELSLTYQNPNVLPLLKTKGMDELAESMQAGNQQTLAKLKEIPASSRIDGVLSLTQALPAEKVSQMFAAEDSQTTIQWLSVAVADPEGEPSGLLLGMDLSATLPLISNNKAYLLKLNETYPELFPWAFQYSRDGFTAETYQTHFTSLLRYLSDHRELLDKMSDTISLESLKAALAYVEEHGVKVNAVYLSGRNQEFRDLAQDQTIWDIKVLAAELYSNAY